MSMIEYQVTIPQWLAFPYDVRLRLKEIFKVPRSEGTHVQDSTVISDGHTHADLKRISVKAMQEYLGEKDKANFYELLESVLEKVLADMEAERKAVEEKRVADDKKANRARREAITATIGRMAAQAESLEQEYDDSSSKETKK